jgi:hypothetical protein
MADYPITDKLGIPRKLVTFQVMRRTLGTDLQEHGTMKDAQSASRHASNKTTANAHTMSCSSFVLSDSPAGPFLILNMSSRVFSNSTWGRADQQTSRDSN